MIEPHGVTITVEKIYEKLVELEVRLGDHPKQVDDHERRIRSLEVKVWGVSGIFAAIGIMVAQIMNGATV